MNLIIHLDLRNLEKQASCSMYRLKTYFMQIEMEILHISLQENYQLELKDIQAVFHK